MNQRMEALTQSINELGLAGLVLNPGASLIYLTGLHFHLMERPTILMVAASGKAVMVLPALEAGKLQSSLAEIQAFTYGDDPAGWMAVFEKAGAAINLGSGKVGVEPTQLRYLEQQYLNRALPEATFVDGSPALAALRRQKDSGEVEKMRRAAIIAQNALLATLKTVREGMSEKVIANELVIQLLRAGSDPDLPFQPIVALGENSANPHAVPTDRALRPGDLLLIDWGATHQGYLSDITRTFTFGAVDEELVQIGEIVRMANEAGRASGGSGVTAGSVDRAARAVIVEAGYGEAFFHRTGHGLGMESHEEPYIYAENDLILQPGMVFTVEPGIYLSGRGGVRIEDDVVVRQDGLESLTDLPRGVLPLEDFMSA